MSCSPVGQTAIPPPIFAQIAPFTPSLTWTMRRHGRSVFHWGEDEENPRCRTFLAQSSALTVGLPRVGCSGEMLHLPHQTVTGRIDRFEFYEGTQSGLIDPSFLPWCSFVSFLVAVFVLASSHPICKSLLTKRRPSNAASIAGDELAELLKVLDNEYLGGEHGTKNLRSYPHPTS